MAKTIVREGEKVLHELESCNHFRVDLDDCTQLLITAIPGGKTFIMRTRDESHQLKEISGGQKAVYRTGLGGFLGIGRTVIVSRTSDKKESVIL